MTTRITEDNITPGSITANSIAEGISLGGGGGVTVDQIIVTDSSFNNTANTEIISTGGFLKIYGSGFQANANAYLSTSLSIASASQITANVVSENEIRLTTGSVDTNTYNLFLINTNGSNATKLNFVTSVFYNTTLGYFAGGGSSRVQRISFADDTATASLRGTLSLSSRYAVSATGNDGAGWYTGGSSPSKTRVDRITFADDTGTASIRGPLSLARSQHGSTGNDNYGWFGGGGPSSRVDRITFADDTGTASVRGPLSLARNNLTATGNINYGWFGGGGSSSRVDRITFADDTGTASIRGPLSLDRGELASTGNQNYGWFAGGGSTITRVDRIDFAADTLTASVRGPLNAGRYRSCATGNQEYGWFNKGLPTNSTRVDRITFADDTVTTSQRGTLNFNDQGMDAVSGIA